ncbi:MAG: DNA-binding protein, partial [Oscillospiraceae bacterium]|nr:DNA-binding protein [Oscillospiraceae bacterium]
ITRQGVRDNIKRGENYLLDLEEKVGVFKRQRQFNKQLEQISEKLGQISMVSMTDEDKNLLNEIKALCEKLAD